MSKKASNPPPPSRVRVGNSVTGSVNPPTRSQKPAPPPPPPPSNKKG
ncbi:MAG: hypothetical protein HRT93_06725 [Piscirickettsiaceae bacterium]|nr:hypothetical protein [Piscirickettsiaceae bacterium]